ncbi:hypothetical protein OO17_25200 [Rhodopseudomonas palustris]|uniref:FAD-binding FR-type domain-containing protein n=1 Tax=Rhodopseudomonas palustris TaxID=1076 RepID=A0A0D7E4Y1_RHOPL|nr:hypothetical protein OO17_25200 [Rhodopseudomonas palustris]
MLRRLLMRRATIVAADWLAEGFRLVTLEGQALRGVVWTPGQKVQVAVGTALATRTYTPIDWDPEQGRTRILCFAHGDGPGSAWVRGVGAGDGCDILGPRASLDAGHGTGALGVFGDETSIGLAYALAQQDPARSISSYFEIGNKASAEHVRTALQIRNVTLFLRSEGDAHLAQMEAALSPVLNAGAAFVLTGKASTVQRLRHELKRRGVPANRVVTKAYWAPGKTGMD